MRLFHSLRLVLLGCAAAAAALAQAPPVIMQVPNPELVKPQTPPPQAQPAPARQAPGAQPQTQPAAPRLADSRGFLLGGVSLSEMIDILAKMMKINYILDPRVKGSVTIYTYGEVKPVDLMPLMETILRVNGAAMVKVGDLYRIVPVNAVSQLPVDPVVNADSKTLPDDERIVLNLIFLKYATAGEIDKLLAPFYGEGASHSTYDPANLLIIQDNSRNMKRTMELISLFDSDAFAGQRVRLFDVNNSRPSDLVKELDSVFKAYSLSEKSSAVKFIPVDRINTLIAVAPNPGIFVEVSKWIDKLDIPVKITAGAVSNYVYRLKYGRAETVAMAIMALYSGNPMAMIGLSSMMYGGMGYGGGGMGYGGGGMGYGGGGMGYGGGGMGYGGDGAWRLWHGRGGMGLRRHGVQPELRSTQLPAVAQRGADHGSRGGRPLGFDDRHGADGRLPGHGSAAAADLLAISARHTEPLRQHAAGAGHSAGLGADQEPAAAVGHSPATGADRRQDLRTGPDGRVFSRCFGVPGQERHRTDLAHAWPPPREPRG